MITQDQIKPGLEIIQESNGYTASARNGIKETHYRILDQRCEYSWNVLILERDGNIYPNGLTSDLCLADIKKCYIKQ